MAELTLFNVAYGYLDGICRGLRAALLTPDDYRKLGMAENLDDLRTALEETDYGTFMEDEMSPLAVTTFDMKCREKMAAEFKYMHSHADEKLAKFMDFVLLEKMIDNVIGLIQGSLSNRPTEEIVARLDPLGWFPEIKYIATMDLNQSNNELYRILLIDSPVGPYFDQYLETLQSSDGRSVNAVASIFVETDLELLRNLLKKAWLEDFYAHVCKLGGTTKLVMEHLLKSEADFRVLSVTLNSINTPLGGNNRLQDRNTLYPSLGYLYPDGTDRIRKAWNDTTIQTALQPVKKYSKLYEQCKSFYSRGENVEMQAVSDSVHFKSLEDLLFAEQVKICEEAFDYNCHFGIFYAWIKLKEQEIRNIVWMADMILMNQRDHIMDILPLFASAI